MHIPIEDTFADVLGKACRGRGWDVDALAKQSGISPAVVGELIGGKFEESGARALASALALQPDRLVALAKNEYLPAEIAPMDGLACFNTPFSDMTVNSYLVWDPISRKAAAFDTGTDCSGMLETAAAHNLAIVAVYLTHAHGDHVFEFDRLIDKTHAKGWIGGEEKFDGPEAFSPGREFQLGGLKITTRSTWGHSPGGVTYVIDGLSRPLAIVGDAMFAGSMGGGNVSYQAALETNRKHILSLPDDTILCPGHGPLTTVGEQKRVNPFFPG